MIYTLCKQMISKGQTENMQEKLNVFFAANQLTTAQYEELTTMLKG